MVNVHRMLARLIREDSAQELVEYALLGFFVALAGAAVWNAILGLLGTSYTEYNTDVQNQWNPPDP